MKLAFLISGALLLGAVLGSGGCHDPQADAAAQRRMQRIDHDLTAAKERENDGPRRIQRTLDTAEGVEDWRPGWLQRDLHRIDDRAERDVREWNDRQPQREAAIQEYILGKPERLHEVAGKMVN
jgi:hypothetical protein